jgi:hypothetical protein
MTVQFVTQRCNAADKPLEAARVSHGAEAERVVVEAGTFACLTRNRLHKPIATMTNRPVAINSGRVSLRSLIDCRLSCSAGSSVIARPLRPINAAREQITCPNPRSLRWPEASAGPAVRLAPRRARPALASIPNRDRTAQCPSCSAGGSAACERVASAFYRGRVGTPAIFRCRIKLLAHEAV